MYISYVKKVPKLVKDDAKRQGTRLHQMQIVHKWLILSWVKDPKKMWIENYEKYSKYVQKVNDWSLSMTFTPYG